MFPRLWYPLFMERIISCLSEWNLTCVLNLHAFTVIHSLFHLNILQLHQNCEFYMTVQFCNFIHPVYITGVNNLPDRGTCLRIIYGILVGLANYCLHLKYWFVYKHMHMLNQFSRWNFLRWYRPIYDNYWIRHFCTVCHL